MSLNMGISGILKISDSEHCIPLTPVDHLKTKGYLFERPVCVSCVVSMKLETKDMHSENEKSEVECETRFTHLPVWVSSSLSQPIRDGC